MADVTATKANVSLLNSGPTFRGTAGGTLTAGQAVYINGTSGVTAARANAAGTAKVAGVVVAPKDAASGDPVDVAAPGALVGGFSGLTPGDLLYLSDTATGILGTTPGTKAKPVARAISATEIMITLEGTDPA